MKLPSISELRDKAKTATKRAGKAITTAQTGVEKRRAKALKAKADREAAEIKRYEKRLNELKKLKKHAKTKAQVQSKQRQIEDIRSQLSLKDRIIFGIKKNANKTIDKNLKKHGL